jgi:hypothetical protein
MALTIMDTYLGDAINWLLSSAEPAVRMLTRRDLFGENTASTSEVLDGAMMLALLSGSTATAASASTRAAKVRFVLVASHHAAIATPGPGRVYSGHRSCASTSREPVHVRPDRTSRSCPGSAC